MKKNVFLSHASPDKLKVAELARELDQRGITYWLDEAEIGWGDPISKRINDGLKNSQFVIVFLSDAFVGRSWPELELNSAITRENEEGETVVLPIVLGDPGHILSEYPLLRQKAFLKWDSGIINLADHLQRKLGHSGQGRKEPLARGWEPLLSDLLKKNLAVLKGSGLSDQKLISLQRRLGDPSTSRDAAFSAFGDVVSHAVQMVQASIFSAERVLLKLEGEIGFRKAIESIDKRAVAMLRALCWRESVPLNFEVIDFYANAARDVQEWVPEFIGNLSLIERWSLKGQWRTSGPMTKALASFLSAKMLDLVDKWRRGTLLPTLTNVAANLESEIPNVANERHDALLEQALQYQVPNLDLLVQRDVLIPAPVIADWMERRVTFTWLSLFSNYSHLEFMQQIDFRSGGTLSERLSITLTKEILLNGEQQELSFFGDLAAYLGRSILRTPIAEKVPFVDSMPSYLEGNREKLIGDLASKQDLAEELRRLSSDLDYLAIHW